MASVYPDYEGFKEYYDKDNQQIVCKCDIGVLMCVGCKCGAIEKEREQNNDDKENCGSGCGSCNGGCKK